MTNRQADKLFFRIISVLVLSRALQREGRTMAWISARYHKRPQSRPPDQKRSDLKYLVSQQDATRSWSRSIGSRELPVHTPHNNENSIAVCVFLSKKSYKTASSRSRADPLASYDLPTTIYGLYRKHAQLTFDIRAHIDRSDMRSEKAPQRGLSRLARRAKESSTPVNTLP